MIENECTINGYKSTSKIDEYNPIMTYTICYDFILLNA